MSTPLYVIAALLALILLVQIVMLILIGLRDYTPAFEGLHDDAYGRLVQLLNQLHQI